MSNSKYKYLLQLSGPARYTAIRDEVAALGANPPQADIIYLTNLWLWNDWTTQHDAAIAANLAPPTKTEFARTYDLPWRYQQSSVPESLDALMEVAAQTGAPIKAAPLGSLPAPPISRRHIDEKALIAAATDRNNGDAAQLLADKRSAIYSTPNWQSDPTQRALARQLSQQLYELADTDDNPIANSDPLTFDWAVVETEPTPLFVRPVVAALAIEDGDFTLDTYNFEPVLAAFASGELYEWGQQLEDSQKAAFIKGYWRYKATIDEEEEVVDLCDADCVRRLLGVPAIKDTPVWDTLAPIAEAALNPIQRIIWDGKWDNQPNKAIQQQLLAATGVSRRENYISTIWKQQIPIAIAEAAQQLQEQIETLFEPELWKRCKVCGRAKPATETYFVRRKQCSDGLAGICKCCEKIKRTEKKMCRDAAQTNKGE